MPIHTFDPSIETKPVKSRTNPRIIERNTDHPYVTKWKRGFAAAYTNDGPKRFLPFTTEQKALLRAGKEIVAQLAFLNAIPEKPKGERWATITRVL